MNELTKEERETMLAARAKIDQLIEFLEEDPNHIKGDDEDVFPLTHTFGGGIYCREIFLPKGHLVVGKIHKTEHPNFLMQGEVLVTSDRDEKGIHLKAPMYFVSKAGIRKVVYAVEDSIWVTVHATDKTNPKEAEEVLIAKTYEELPDSVKKELP